MAKKIQFALLMLLTIIFMGLPAKSAEQVNKMSEKKVLHKHFEVLNSTQTLSYEIIEGVQQNDGSSLKRVFGSDRLYENEVLLITAAEQTAGIGQVGNTWQSPPKVNIYATYVYPWPEKLQAHLFCVPQLSNLAVCQTIQNFGLEPQFKWINDTLINGKKVDGLLCKVFGITEYYRRNQESSNFNNVCLVVGIGLNVNMDEAVAQEKYQNTADIMKMPFTSMRIESGKRFEVNEVLAELSRNLLKNYRIFIENPDFKGLFLTKITPLLAFLGQDVTYQNGSEEQCPAKVIGIADDGQIILQMKDGIIVHKLEGRIRPIQ